MLRGVSFEVEEGKVVAVLGPNGAGKTTMLRAISGMVRRAGTVSFDGEDVTGMKPEKIARARASPTCPRGAAPSPA